MARLAAALALVTVIAAPREAFACPVCFGQNDSALALAMNAGVLMMLGVVVVVLSLFAAFIVYLARRARLGPGESQAPGHRPSHPQEGTVRC